MIKNAGQVLKSDEVRLEGQFHLNTAQAQMNKSQQKNSVLSAPQVRILENNPEYAVISIICTCGTEMSVRCDYADAPASEQSET